ncbi:hypothetical protein MRX96_045617 [Rhipicephalus microplus]
MKYLNHMDYPLTHAGLEEYSLEGAFPSGAGVIASDAAIYTISADRPWHLIGPDKLGPRWGTPACAAACCDFEEVAALPTGVSVAATFFRHPKSVTSRATSPPDAQLHSVAGAQVRRWIRGSACFV